MKKQYIILFISLIALLIGIQSGTVYSQGEGGLLGHFKLIGGPGATVENCEICHDFANGFYEDPPTGYNLRWVKTKIKFCSTSINTACNVDADCPTGERCGYCSVSTQISCDNNSDCPLGQTCILTTRTVNFTKFEDLSQNPDGTLADGNDQLLDGPCEVCHTQTSYHVNLPGGDGTTHYDGNNCTGCHPHFENNLVNYFEPRLVGGQSHYTHFVDPKGPQLGTNSCFIYCHKSSADFRIFNDDQPLETTTKCNTCHSKNGAYNGVGGLGTCSITTSRRCTNDSNCPAGEKCNVDPDWVDYGAKYNWEKAIYERSEPLKAWPDVLKNGKDKWCAGCHDNLPAVVKDAQQTNIYAPKVMGDNTNYGYYVSGHGRDDIQIKCKACHIFTGQKPNGDFWLHIDRVQRTYEASLNNYQEGYRLKLPMIVPRNIEPGQASFDVCIECHSWTDLTGPNSYFRYDKTYQDQNYMNLHKIHLDPPGAPCWDSDWDWTSSNCGWGQCAESNINCTTCHNVHGSPMMIGTTKYPCPTMIRHGELISTPPGTNKVPAFDFSWKKDDGTTPTADFNESWWGGLLCGSYEYENVAYNKVCWGCHAPGRPQYNRSPGKIYIDKLWTSDLSNHQKNIFAKGESIRYHVEFSIAGKGSQYYVTATAPVKRVGGTTNWYILRNSETILRVDYPHIHWQWDDVTKTLGDARITMTIRMYTKSGGILVTKDTQNFIFNVQ